MKTQEEIENLKRQWLFDPCWELEEAEGFEDYKEELYAFKLHCQKNKIEEWEKAWRKKADEIGIDFNPANFKLLKYLDKLEMQIDILKIKIELLDK